MRLRIRGLSGIAALIVGLSICATPGQAILVVDGSLADWGITPGDNNTSDLSPAGGIGLVAMFVEDQDDNAGDGGFVGPNYGGQNYDAEGLYIAVQANELFVAVVSGQRPDNGLTKYAPGDFKLTTSAGTYGIEVGGGQGGLAGGLLNSGDPGSTYNLNSNGFTVSHLDAPPQQTAGSLWLEPTWILDPIPPQTETQLAQQIAGGTYIDNVPYIFTRNTVTSQHSIIEMSIPLSLFGGETITSLSWFPACGNDELIALLSIESIPEPSSVVLAGLAICGGAITMIRRRRRR